MRNPNSFASASAGHRQRYPDLETCDGHDPYAYLKDVLTRLPTQWASMIGQPLPHQWRLA
ncbi:transposase domain-containing protein [Pseudomonas sp. zjy_15]|uniref:transposase domain-containing protein n=1 Tax=unclassified Pseudomonas TaxID=196821 RepID=UPI00370A340E